MAKQICWSGALIASVTLSVMHPAAAMGVFIVVLLGALGVVR